jgi:hypothetical protein
MMTGESGLNCDYITGEAASAGLEARLYGRQDARRYN